MCFYSNDNYSSFENDEIKKLYDEMIVKTNAEVLDDLVLKKEIKSFLVSVINGFKGNVTEWRNILAESEVAKSRDAGNNEPQILSLSVLKYFIKYKDNEGWPRKEQIMARRPSDYRGLDLEKLDTAALTKLIQYSFQSRIIQDAFGTVNRNPALKNAVIYMRDIRNYREGHSTPFETQKINSQQSYFYEFSFRPEGKPNTLLTFNGLLEKIKPLFTAVPPWPEYISKPAKKLYDDLIMIQQMENFIKSGPVIDKSFKGKIDYRYLSSYNIFFAPTSLVTPRANANAASAMFNTLIQMTKAKNKKLSKKYGLNFLSEHYSCVMLYKSPGEKRGDRYKYVMPANYDVIRVLNTDEAGTPNDLIAFLKDKKEKYIVFTGSWKTAEDIWALNKENVIPARIIDEQYFEIFSEKPDLPKKHLEMSEAQSVKQIEEDNENSYAGTKEQEFNPPREMPKEGSLITIDYGYDSSDAKEKYKLLQAIESGAEGTVYEFEDSNECIKIYNDESWDQDTFKKLKLMMGIPKEQRNSLRSICWPKEFVLYKNRYAGFTMNKVRNAITIRDAIADLTENPWGWERSDLVKLCINLATAFKTLHSHNVIMGDIRLENIMVNKDKEVFFIDVDSYQIGEFPSKVGTEEFSSKRMLEAQQATGYGYANIKRTMLDEYFAEAILFFKVLTLDEYPYKNHGSIAHEIINGRYRFSSDSNRRQRFGKDKYNYTIQNLTEEVKSLFCEFFTNAAKDDKNYDDVFIKYFNDLYSSINDNISDSKLSEFKNKRVPNRERYLSNQLKPTAACTEFKWMVSECSVCRKDFWSTGNDICPSCLNERDRERAHVYRKVCSQCGSPFYINEYDLKQQKKMPNEMLRCYDCDDSLYLKGLDADTLSFALANFDMMCADNNIRLDQEGSDEQ